jgi:hypothetical protein
VTNTTTGWVIFVAAIGMTMGLLGAELSALQDWAPIYTPAFVGKACIHLATVISAFIGGKLIPAKG